MLRINRLPPLNSLKCFESAARHGSFNKAARELNVTPSAISHQIKGLEEFLDLELFRRTKRKVVLTEAGEKYLGPIKQMFQLLEQATADLHTAQHAGSLHLAVAPSFLTRWLMPRMERFQQRYPDIELEISSSMGLIDFSIGKVDMAVYFGAGDWDDVEMYYLRPIRLAPVCSPKMIKPSNPINEPEDMRFYPLLHVSKRSDEWTDWLVQNGLDPKSIPSRIDVFEWFFDCRCGKSRLRYCAVGCQFDRPELESGQLKVLFDKQLDTNRSFYLVYEKDRAITPAMTAFKEWIIEEMNDG